MNRTNEAVIEAHLLQNGYVSAAREGFDRERAIFLETVLAFIRDTQPREGAKLEASCATSRVGTSAGTSCNPGPVSIGWSTRWQQYRRRPAMPRRAPSTRS